MKNSQFLVILTLLLLTVSPATISAQLDEDPVSAVTSTNVTSGNIRLYTEEFGDPKNPTVIFISELLQSRLVWEPQLP
ncbi:5248_t:CDS:2 [Ambispora gerdemannii]|uniref:5248_t:CDS:1 n=1 Tax=Ambispora gerdemannii TaxID=144530 RepID=A0A9N9FY42_9GLOM|nr:5248_t:CDS:2 [Ambispora gerdemannii]